MKKVLVFTVIAACAMMVFSCKNNNKEEEKALKNAAGEAIEAVEGAAQDAANAVGKAAKDAADAAKDAIDRTDEALDKLGDIIPAAAADVKPTFEGGDADSFAKYIQKNLKYPQAAVDNGEQGRVVVNFVVDATGKIRNAKVVSGVSELLDAEALRVVSSAPNWTPAKKDGKNIPVNYSVPVIFTIK